MKIQILLISTILNIQKSFLIRLALIFFGIFFVFCPLILQANEIDEPNQGTEHEEIFEAPSQMTQEQMNDLFGADPYLGQTSYLQSPDGFTERKKSR